MQQLLEWTLDAIREEHSDFSWMEEFRYDWTPLAKSAVSKIVGGQTVLILTDPSRKWFCKYIINAMNSPRTHRPFLPVYTFQALFPAVRSIENDQQIELMEDMLNISFPNGYFFWYIGESDHFYTKIAYRNDENFLWVIDGEVPNSFRLRSGDDLLDIKLLQLYRLFEKTCEATLFGVVDLDR